MIKIKADRLTRPLCGGRTCASCNEPCRYPAIKRESKKPGRKDADIPFDNRTFTMLRCGKTCDMTCPGYKTLPEGCHYPFIRDAVAEQPL